MFTSTLKTSRKIEGLALAIISSGTYGLIPLFCLPLLSNGMTADSICFYRFILSAIVMSLLMLWKKVDFKINVKEYFITFAVALFYALTGLLLTLAYDYIASGIVTTMHFLYPILVTVIMGVLFKERISKLRLFAIFLAVLGVFFLCGGTDMFAADNAVNIKGYIFVIMAIITYSLYIVCVNKVPALQKMDSNKLTFYVLINGAIIFLALIMVKGGEFSPISNMQDISNLLLLTITATLISDLALINAIKMIGSTPTSILGCMEPLTAVVIGYFVFHEELTLLQILGITTILVAVYFVIITEPKSQQ